MSLKMIVIIKLGTVTFHTWEWAHSLFISDGNKNISGNCSDAKVALSCKS